MSLAANLNPSLLCPCFVTDCLNVFMEATGLNHKWGFSPILSCPPGMYGLPRPWYFPLQKSYWLGSGRVETWECPWGGGARLSVMEEDQACAMEHRRSGRAKPDLGLG